MEQKVFEIQGYATKRGGVYSLVVLRKCSKVGTFAAIWMYLRGIRNVRFIRMEVEKILFIDSRKRYNHLKKNWEVFYGAERTNRADDTRQRTEGRSPDQC